MTNFQQNDDTKILELYKTLKDEGWHRPYSAIAELLGVPEKSLLYWLYRKSEARFYETFLIKKRGGGTREINAPQEQLKMLQQRLNYILQLVSPVKPVSHAFTKSKSIITNAEGHVGKKHILNFDLKDFFPSINYGRVYGLFKSKPFSFTDKVAAALAKLCTYKGVLPQGAPTSPVISNLICRRLDQRFTKLAKEYGCVYSRYADDITFSTHQKRFPKEIAIRDSAGFVQLGGIIMQIVEENGFNIKHKKTRLLTAKDRQIVTGLVVNKKLNVTRKYIRQIRAMLHALEKYGSDAASNHFFTKYYFKHRGPDREDASFEAVLEGKITFLRQVREYDDSVDPLTRTLYNRFCNLTGQFERLLPVTQEEKDKLDLFDNLKSVKEIENKRIRGLEFQTFLFAFFNYFGLCPSGSFTGTAQEIDDSFEYGGHTYLVEAKYKGTKTSLSDLVSFQGKVRRRSAGTRGMFISFNGFTPNAVQQFQSEQQNHMVILMDGADIEYILQNPLSLPTAIRLKLKHLQQRGNLSNSLPELEVLYANVL